MKSKYTTKIREDKKGLYFTIPKEMVKICEIKPGTTANIYYKKGSGKFVMEVGKHWLGCEFK